MPAAGAVVPVPSSMCVGFAAAGEASSWSVMSFLPTVTIRLTVRVSLILPSGPRSSSFSSPRSGTGSCGLAAAASIGLKELLPKDTAGLVSDEAGDGT